MCRYLRSKSASTSIDGSRIEARNPPTQNGKAPPLLTGLFSERRFRLLAGRAHIHERRDRQGSPWRGVRVGHPGQFKRTGDVPTASPATIGILSWAMSPRPRSSDPRSIVRRRPEGGPGHVPM